MKNLNSLWKILSFFVPIPEGYAVGKAIYETLHWNLVVVWISAGIVALTGFLAIDVTNKMSEFNSSLTEDEKKRKLTAQTWRGGIVLLIWFTGVVALTVFLKVVPALATWTPLGLVIVGSSAAWLRSINKGQDARELQLAQARAEQAEETRKQKEQVERDRQEERNQRRETRKARQAEKERLASMKQAISTTLQASARSKSGPKGEVADPDKRSGSRKSSVSDEQLILEYQNNRYITSKELAEKFSVSRQAIDQKRDALEKSGLLKVVRYPNGRVECVETVAFTVGQGSR